VVENGQSGLCMRRAGRAAKLLLPTVTYPRAVRLTACVSTRLICLSMRPVVSAVPHSIVLHRFSVEHCDGIGPALSAGKPASARGHAPGTLCHVVAIDLC
jgi:hypothetical protein